MSNKIDTTQWHYLEHGQVENYSAWVVWLSKYVGNNDWCWRDHAGHLFICFKHKEDATAFKLNFEICLK